MDVFAWLDEEPTLELLRRDPRLMEATYRISAAASDNRHAEVDALCAQGIPLARQFNSPWLEVYLRHWRLQSTIFKRLAIKDNLREAVELVERAHREDAIGCPQSVCATQDLCAAYGRADGAAYIEERLAASRSTLDRIDPRWPCWRCISAEYASALVDAGRHAEALDWIEENVARVRAAHPGAPLSEFLPAWVESLVAQGRLEEALTLSQRRAHRDDSEQYPLERALEQAWIHLRAGRLEQARERLPSLTAIRDTPDFYRRWTEVTCGLLAAGQVALEPPLLGQLLELQRALRRNGALGLAARCGEALAEALLRLGWLPAAAALLDELGALATERVRPAEAAAALEPLRARLAAAQAAQAAALPLEDDLAAARARFEAAPPPLSERLAALARWPGEVDWALAAAALWERLHFPERAVALVEAQLAHAPPGDAQLLRWLGERHLKAGHLEALDALLARACPADAPRARRSAGRWLTARLHEARGEAAAARATLEAHLAADPADAAARARLAALYRAAGDLTAAQDQLEHLTEGPPGPADWDLMLIATQRGDWAAVRASAARLGLGLTPGDGPVSESWEPVLVTYPAEGPARYAALRTGPVTAEIHQPSPFGEPNHEGDLVAFEPRPINPEADGERLPYCFPVAAILRPGARRTWPLDGQRPPQGTLTRLEVALSSLGGKLYAQSDDHYHLTGPRGTPVTGLYALLSVPEALPKATLCETLKRILGQTRMTWLPLLDPDLDPAEHARQRALAQALGLPPARLEGDPSR